MEDNRKIDYQVKLEESEKKVKSAIEYFDAVSRANEQLCMQIEFLSRDFIDNPTPGLKETLVNLYEIGMESITKSKIFASSLYSGAVEEAYRSLWNMKSQRLYTIKEETRNFVPQKK
jgi:hypothetical protein